MALLFPGPLPAHIQHGITLTKKKHTAATYMGRLMVPACRFSLNFHSIDLHKSRGGWPCDLRCLSMEDHPSGHVVIFQNHRNDSTVPIPQNAHGRQLQVSGLRRMKANNIRSIERERIPIISLPQLGALTKSRNSLSSALR